VEFPYRPIILSRGNNITSNNFSNIPVLVLDILIELFGDRKSLEDALLEVYNIESKYFNINTYKNDYEYELGFLIPLLDWDRNKLNRHSKPEFRDYYNKDCKIYL